jgi:type I restriction enzyme R subunit
VYEEREMPTDTSEKGLESLIFKQLTGVDGLYPAPDMAAERPSPYGIGYHAGCPKDYDRGYALDTAQLFAFLRATQPEELGKLGDVDRLGTEDIRRHKFLERLSSELGRRGVIDVLRKGLDDGPVRLELYYELPSEGNQASKELYARNRFSITRQLAYSRDETRRALDLCLFINGLPFATFELKNSLTKQTVADAIEQYRRDRLPSEKLFAFGRCAVHFAVDDSEVAMCTELRGRESWFLPFNKGYKDGAGNPPNPQGIKTDYLWREILEPSSLSDIVEHYAQIVEEKDRKTKKTTRKQIWPRYHQLETVRALLADAKENGAGSRYLVQHSAGSGKSNSIAWLAHQLVALKRGGKEVFDAVIVAVDRRVLDGQLHGDIRNFMQVSATVGHAESAEQLKGFLEAGKKIVVSTVQKFPIIMRTVEADGERRFAILIDEAHSSQGGKVSGAMSAALSGSRSGAAAAMEDPDADSEEDAEDWVNEELERRISEHKLLRNASYFAFTATPKPKTLEMFGIPLPPNAEGKIRHKPFRSYTMKQAIEERFILDVLKSYTPVKSYYNLVKKIEDDPEFDAGKANKKLRRYVEGHEKAIERKAEIMADHFFWQVYKPGKVGGQARAMVVCNGIERAIAAQKYPFKAIVAFSGEHEYKGNKETEASLNGFPSADIRDRFKEDPYRFLVCADKFQTGYDEPLLHTMYVDKTLAGIKAVQTLSRINRAHPKKSDCFILDFANETEAIAFAFQDYYKTTILSEETDPNALHDLRRTLDDARVYTADEVGELVELFLEGAPRDRLDPILDACRAAYESRLGEDEQVAFKGDAKAFCRTYDFLAAILPYSMVEWEKLSIFLNLLIPKLPAPKEEDLSKGILEAIDMESYRIEKKKTLSLALEDEDADIDPRAVTGGKEGPDPILERLSVILADFNKRFGTEFTDGDRIVKRIKDEIAPTVDADPDYRNARENTPQNAGLALDAALDKVMRVFLKDDIKAYKLYVENEDFNRFVHDMVLELTKGGPAA